MSSQQMKKLMESIDRLSMMQEEQSSVTDEQIQELITGFEKGLAILSKMNDEQLDEAGWKSKLGSLAVAGGLAMGLGGAKDASAQNFPNRVDQGGITKYYHDRDPRGQQQVTGQQEVTGFKRQEISKMAKCAGAARVMIKAVEQRVERGDRDPAFEQLMTVSYMILDITNKIKMFLVTTPAEASFWRMNVEIIEQESAIGGRISPSELRAIFRYCVGELGSLR